MSYFSLEGHFRARVLTLSRGRRGQTRPVEDKGKLSSLVKVGLDIFLTQGTGTWLGFFVFCFLLFLSPETLLKSSHGSRDLDSKPAELHASFGVNVTIFSSLYFSRLLPVGWVSAESQDQGQATSAL